MQDITPTKNERLALLLGYRWMEHVEHRIPVLVSAAFDGSDRWVPSAQRGTIGIPDFDSWERYPELQAYVRGLAPEVHALIDVALTTAIAAGGGSNETPPCWIDVTPTLLGSAILEVCGE